MKVSGMETRFSICQRLRLRFGLAIHMAVWGSVGVILLATPAFGLDPERQISQYGHTAWRTRDGVFAGSPHAITQTTDGYLWIGTEAGLVRFDGASFVPWVPPKGTSLPSPVIISLLAGRDGSLWIGTGAGLARWKNQTLTNFTDAPGRINAILEDRDGTVWMGRSRILDKKGPLCQVTGASLRCHGDAEGFDFTTSGVEPLAEDPQGGLWVGTVRGVCHYRGGSLAKYFLPALENANGGAGVLALASQPDGSVWVGIGQNGKRMGLQRLKGGVWTEYAVPGFRSDSLEVNALLIDGDKGLWVATVSDGLYHISNGQVDHFGQADGLSSDGVESMYEDREGNIWVATPQGIDRFRNLAVSTLSKRQGLSSDNVMSVFASAEGTVWAGNAGALDSIRGNKVTAIRAGSGLPGQNVSALFEDHAGRVWLGTNTGLITLEGGRFRKVTISENNDPFTITGIVQDKAGDIWVLITGRPQKLIRLHNGRIAETVTPRVSVWGAAIAPDPHDGIWFGHRDGSLTRYASGRSQVIAAPPASAQINNLEVDSSNSAWGASTKGLVRWKDGLRRTLGVRNGLPCERLFSSVIDNAGDLWLYASCGLMTISSKEIERWWLQPDASIDVRLFDIFDGAQPGGAPFRPVVSKSPDGRLWFTNDRILQFIDPGRAKRNQLPPPVRIEQIIADQRVYPAGDQLRLPPLTRNIQIDYTALSFVVPQKVRFRYKLEGHDDQWREPGTRRQAFYEDLLPRQYRFRVIACNNDGVWNETGATLSFLVEPAYYQTVAFRLFCALTLVTVFWALYQRRVGQIAAQLKERFDERMAERNRLSGELHDTVLQSIQASKMFADSVLEDEADNDPARLRRAVQSISVWLSQAEMEGRAALAALRSSTTLHNDLPEAFQRTAEAASGRCPMEFVVAVEGTPREMHPILRDEIYRIGSEAIRNACLHSGGNKLDISLTYSHNLTLLVRDDGKGLAPDVVANGKAGHFGLSGMQERANRIGAAFSISSRPNFGTEIQLTVPGSILFREPPPGAATIAGRLRSRLGLSSRPLHKNGEHR